MTTARKFLIKLVDKMLLNNSSRMTFKIAEVQSVYKNYMFDALSNLI